MLTDIRKLADHFLFKVFSFLIIISFVSWGISDILRDKSDVQLVTFDIEKAIYGNEFAQAKHERIKYIQSVVKSPLTEEQMAGLNIDRIVLDGLINERMLDHIAFYYKLYFSDDNMIAEVKKNPSFFDREGKFSYEVFASAVRNSGLSEVAYLGAMKKDLSSKIIFDNFDNSTIFSTALSEQVAKYLNTEIVFDLITANPSIQMRNLKIPDDQIQNFYNNHKSEFVAEEFRDIEYIEIAPNIVKVHVSDEEIQRYYKDNISEFNNPATFSFYNIPVASKEHAERIFTHLRTSNDFAMVEDLVSGRMVQFFKSNVTEEEIGSKFAKLLKSDESVFIVEEAGKYHILKKEVYIPAKLVEFAEAKKDIELTLRQKKFDVAFSDLVREIDDYVAGAESLKQVAEKFNLSLKQQKKVLKSENNKIAEKASEMAEGDFSEVFELSSGNSAILFVQKLTPSRELAFDEVKADISKKLQKELVYKDHLKKMNQVKENTNKAKDFGFEVLAEKKITVANINSGNIEDYPEQILRELLSLKNGESTSVIEYNGKIYLAILKNKAHTNNISYKKINSTIAKNNQSAILDEIFLFLRKDSNMKVQSNVTW
jgi:hypothetical protein